MANTSIRRMGNSQGVILPKTLLSSLGLGTGDVLSLAVEEGRIVLTPAPLSPRDGWAEAAAGIAAAGDDGLAWPEIGNADDAALQW